MVVLSAVLATAASAPRANAQINKMSVGIAVRTPAMMDTAETRLPKIALPESATIDTVKKNCGRQEGKQLPYECARN